LALARVEGTVPAEEVCEEMAEEEVEVGMEGTAALGQGNVVAAVAGYEVAVWAVEVAVGLDLITA
jgi:hypothetical protein